MSVVTHSQYRQITRDYETSEADVSANLDIVEAIVEDYLKRPLAAVQRTEECLVYAGSRLYPLATPILSVSSPAAAVIHRELYLTGVTPLADFLIEESSLEPDYVTVTYVGGWTSLTIPDAMARMIARLAQQLERATVSSSQFPVGATSLSLGDASISFASPTGGAGELDTLLPGATAALRKWRRRI